jgi:hypothetical protein
MLDDAPSVSAHSFKLFVAISCTLAIRHTMESIYRYRPNPEHFGHISATERAREYSNAMGEMP